MAYQNVGKPRFFIDNYQYLRALGLAGDDYASEDDNLELEQFKHPFSNPKAFNMTPEKDEDLSNGYRFLVPSGDQLQGMDFSGNMKWYTAILNHNLGDSGFIRINAPVYYNKISFSSENALDTEYTNILNAEIGNMPENGTSIFYTDMNPDAMASYILDDASESGIFNEQTMGNLIDMLMTRYTGFTLTHDDHPETDISNLKIGAISQGVMYTMSHSVDLDLTMEVELDGFDSNQTLGGSTLTNIRYTGSPNWTNNGQFINPFGVGSYSNNSALNGAKRNGRRSWKLKFSLMSAEDLFASNYMLNDYLENDGNTGDYDSNDLNTDGNKFEYNVFTDDSFVAQVWNKTLGGALPFIFQPDSNNNQADQFCLAKFDQDSLSMKQSAHNVYDFSVVIREVW